MSQQVLSISIVLFYFSPSLLFYVYKFEIGDSIGTNYWL